MSDVSARINVTIEGPVAEWLQLIVREADTNDVEDAIREAIRDLWHGSNLGYDVEVKPVDFDQIKAASDPLLDGKLVIVEGNHDPMIAKVVHTSWEDGTWHLDTVTEWSDHPWGIEFDEDDIDTWMMGDVDALTAEETEAWLAAESDTDEVEARIFKVHGYGE